MNLRFAGWFYLLCSSAVCTAAFGDILIMEFVAASSREFLDEDGDASDWIELQNASDVPTSVGGWSVTDVSGS